jgi:multicomponent Na+:H+ antiporter subunit D
VFAGDLVSLVVFWEISTLTSAAIIFARRSRPAYRAGVRYLVIQMISGLMLLGGVCLYGVQSGTFLMAELAPLQEGVLLGLFDPSTPGGLMILLGAGIKAGFPLAHNALTDAYPNTTDTGAAVLSPFATTMAVYVLARGFPGLEALIWIGALMTVYPVFFAVMENDLRKVLAYSTNNQIGFMVCAVGIGTPLALNGAAAHAVAHIVFKMLLFMSMGAIFLRTGTTKASELGGLHRTMPWTTLFCLVGAMSISALPWFSGFASKSMIMTSAHADHSIYMIWLVLLFASAGVLEHSGIKVPYFAFFSHDSGKRPKEAPFTMLLAMGMAAALSMAIGIAPRWFYELLPFRDQALEYLALDLFTPRHILEQMQLLAFAGLAFLILKRIRLYPPEKPGVIIDVEWLWRKGGPWLASRLKPPGALAGSRSLPQRAGNLAVAAIRQAFAPEGIAARRFPLLATAGLTLAMLAVVLGVSLLAR